MLRKNNTISGIMALDGEDQDAYVLGVDKPLKTFSGIVIAIVHRFDDAEEKWVVALTHGLSSGAGIMIGRLLGKNQLDKAKEYGKHFWNVAAISGVINIGLIAIVGPLVYIFYVLEPQAKTYLVQMLIFMAIYMFAYAYNTIITCGIFPAGGDSKYDAITVILATWCFAMPLSLLGCFVFDWSVMVVYVVMCLDEIIKVPFIRWRYNKYIWLKNLTRE